MFSNWPQLSLRFVYLFWSRIQSIAFSCCHFSISWPQKSPGPFNLFAGYSLAFEMLCKINWHTPFPIWNQSVVPYPVPTVASWPEYRFLKRQVRSSGIPISQNFPQFVLQRDISESNIIVGDFKTPLSKMNTFALHVINPLWEFFLQEAWWQRRLQITIMISN